MGELGEFNAHNLEDTFPSFPSFPWYTSKDIEFHGWRQTYCASNPAVPRAILRPRSAEDVSAIVSFARQFNIPFSVRTGGHDLYGRSIVHDALCIDMRDIEFVRVAADRKTAVVGGGIRFGKLLTDLHSHGLTTPHGSVPAIGYAGWASLGGYGCSSTHFGLGVDQIMEAEVVNDQGEIVRADEQMLKGIRGAGGNFGVITSLRIKVYEVNMLLAGILTLDVHQGIAKLFKDVMLQIQNMDSLKLIPLEAVLQPLVLNNPEVGQIFCVTYVWSSDDHIRGYKALEEIIKRLPTSVISNTVCQMSPPEWIGMLDRYIARSVWGGPQSVNFEHLSPRVLDIMGHHLEDMPCDAGACFSLHLLSKGSPSVRNAALTAGSCFNPQARQPHVMVEIVGSALSEASMADCGRWAERMRDALVASGEAMSSAYISLSMPGSMKVQDMYGDSFEFLKKLKLKYDPDGLFRYAVPRLSDLERQ